jgi:hypothetical protein
VHEKTWAISAPWLAAERPEQRINAGLIERDVEHEASFPGSLFIGYLNACFAVGVSA